jgi:nucleotide-binding universal stress UspA family protein
MLFSRILVAVDGSESSDKVFDIAAQLSKLSGGKLLVVHVIQPLSVGGSGFDYYPDSSTLERLQKDLEERGKSLLSKYSSYAEKKYNIAVETILAKGSSSPADVILREASSKAADLIVVGSKGFSGVKQFFIGSVPNSVLHQADIPVLLVK